MGDSCAFLHMFVSPPSRRLGLLDNKISGRKNRTARKRMGSGKRILLGLKTNLIGFENNRIMGRKNPTRDKII